MKATPQSGITGFRVVITTVTEQQHSYPAVEYYCPPRKTVQVAITERVTINKLETQHRVKPGPDSPSFLTARPAQSRSMYTAKRTHRHWYNCVDSTLPLYTITQLAIPSWPTVTNNLPETNWALALRLKLQDDKVSFAESIGEWRDSVELLESSARTLKRAVKTAKRLLRTRRRRRLLLRWFRAQFGRNPNDKLELIDAVSVDLAIKFGIKPLAALAWDSVEVLDRIKAVQRRIQVTLRAEDEVVQVLGKSKQVLKRRVSDRAIAYVRYKLDDSDFTAGNLGEALWAGTRLSFMVDWFWNFGSYLSSFNAMEGVESFQGVLCKRITATGVDRRVPDGYVLDVPGKMTFMSYERSLIGTKIPLASLPKVSIPNSDIWGRLVSSIEVLYSLRKTL